MFFTLALTLIATTSGALLTYLYDEDASLAARVCAGACTGLAALGLLGFIFASFMGLGALSLSLSAAVLAAPVLLLSNDELRAAVRSDLLETWRLTRRAVLYPTWSTIGYSVFYFLVALLLWFVFERVLFELPEGIYTGVMNNYGDLPFHLSVITSFARGENFPPQDPTFAGVRFTYPFISDFVAAMFVRAGASLRGAMFVENFVLALSFVGLLHRWTLSLVRDRLAALFAVVLLLFSGGLGWIRFLREVYESRVGLFNYLVQLPQAYTIGGVNWRWGNALTTLLVPQRSILFGLPLALLIFTLFWQTFKNDKDAETQENNDALTQGRVDAGKVKRKKEKGRRSGRASQRQEAALRAGASARQRVSLSSSLRVSTMKRMIAAGLIAGLLPLVHAHTLMVVLLVGGLLAVLRAEWRAWAIGMGALVLLTAGLAYLSSTVPAAATAATPFLVKVYALCAVLILAGGAFVWLLRGPRWREWLAFFIVATIIAAPQLWWAAHGGAVDARSFIGWHLGWDHGNESVWRFWLKNTGLFIPLLLIALLWRWTKPLMTERLIFYYLPFTLCFIIPNLVLLAPWVWDNIKVLFYWYVASVPLVALLVARLWRLHAATRVAAIVLLLALTLSGGLDVWRVVSEASQQREFDRAGVAFAEIIKSQTAPRSLILHAPTYNHPVYLTGRRALMGYTGHLWSQGIDFKAREAELKRMFAGAPDAESLMAKYGVEYAVVSPLERSALAVNEQFFRRFTKVGETGGYSLYKLTRR